MSALYVDSIKDKSDTKTLATLSNSTVTLHSDVTIPASIGGSEVLLNTFTANNSSNILAITGMSTTYTTYKFVVTQLKAATDSIRLYWFLKKADGTVRSTGYKGARDRTYYNGTGSGGEITAFGDNLFGNDSDLSNAHTYNGVFYVFDPASSSNYTHGVGLYNYVNDSTYNIALRSGCHYATAEAHTDINLQTESDNLVSGTVRMYGIK